MNINVQFQGLQNFFRAGGFGARLFGNVPFFGPVANQAGAAAGLLGLFARFGRLGGAITAAATAIATLASVTIRAARNIAETGIAGLATGGSAAQSVMLRGFGGMAGLGMDAMGGIGERLGGFNRAGAFLDAVRRLQTITTLEGKLAYLRARGIEELFPLAFLTERHTRLLEQERDARAGLFSPAAVAKAQSFNFEVERLKRNFSDAATGIGSVLMPQAERFLNWVNNIFGNRLNQALGGGQTGNNLNQAAANLNQAAAYLSGGARAFGGGIRTQGAIPAALRGEVANQALARGNFWLGDLVP